MARPARFNADYFTHSADLRNDRRVKAIRTAYGAAGYGIFTMLLEALTDADNTALAVDEMEIELLAGDFGVSATEIHSLLQFGIKVGYFATNEAGLLTCPELNSWLAPVFDKRNRARNAAPAALLPQPATVTGVSVTVNPQSKVKESRVEQQPMSDSATPSPDGAGFDSFWDAYGRKEGSKGKIGRQWNALKLATRQTILNGLTAYKQAKTINGPQYLPMPQTFLNGKLWEAETYGHAAPLLRQTPNDIPSNWPAGQPYVLAPVSLGVPNISSMLKPEYQIK